MTLSHVYKGWKIYHMTTDNRWEAMKSGKVSLWSGSLDKIKELIRNNK